MSSSTSDASGRAPEPTDTGFEIIGARTLSHTSFLRLDRLHVVAPDGTALQRETVRHPGAVAIVPVVETDGVPCVVMIRQYRAPIDQMLLEIPAGKLDVPGEPGEAAAYRELAEEVGLIAGSMKPLIGFHTGAGFNDEFITVFVATGCTPTDVSPDGPEEETAEVVTVPLAEIAGLIASGSITDAKSQIGLMAYLNEEFRIHSPDAPER